MQNIEIEHIPSNFGDDFEVEIIDGQKYLFFFRPNEVNGIFSNFAPIQARDRDIVFPTGEHNFHYKKAMLFGDTETAEKILKAKTPMQAKRLGRQVKNFDPKVWDEKKYNIMFGVIDGKAFGPDELQYDLSNCYEVGVHFVECNPYDRIWGIGKKTTDRSKWGQNLLGKAMDEVAKMYHDHFQGYHNCY